MNNNSNAMIKPGSAQQPDSFTSIEAEMLALSGRGLSGGSGGLTMTSASWMQVAARATQLAAQLREMENLGLSGAGASRHSNFPLPSTTISGGSSGTFAPQQAFDGSSAMWSTAQAGAMGPYSHPVMHLLYGGAAATANPSVRRCRLMQLCGGSALTLTHEQGEIFLSVLLTWK